MKKQLLIFILVFIVLLSLATAIEQQNFWDLLSSGNLLMIDTGKSHRDSALTGWYPVEEWEVETCTRDVTSSFTPTSQSNTGTFSPANLIIDTTITMQASQLNFELQPNYKEYEVAWYVYPFGNTSIEYEIQYYTDTWNSFQPPEQKTATPVYGDMGHKTWTGDYNMTKMRLITKDGEFLEIQVVQE